MAQYIVTVDKLNKRKAIPESLPDATNIAGVVYKDYIFEGSQVPANKIPNPALGTWYQGTDGYFYWGPAIALAPNAADTPTGDNTALTLQKLSAGSGAQLDIVTKFLTYVIDTFNQYAIDSPIRQLCFLAQIGHESAGLYYTQELASGQEYEGRHDLGNTQPGDGVKYKGRGLIQITGRGNYQWISNDLKVDFVNNPELLGGKTAPVCTPDQLKYASLSAGCFWNNHELNKIADLIDIKQPIDSGTNLEQFELITKRINGGYNGLSDRVARYKAGVSHFI